MVGESPGQRRHRPPIPKPINNSHVLMASYLEAYHHQDRDDVKMAFGSNLAVAPEQRFLINTVTVPEGIFAADYLDIPRANICTVQTRRLNGGKRAVLQSEVERFLKNRGRLSGGVITFIGHQTFDTATDMPRLGRLSSYDIWEMVNSYSLLQVNFFSCISERMADEVRALFKKNQTDIPRTVCFEGEVSPYPSTARKNKPLRFFYAGPEIGGSTSQLNLRQHSPMIDHLVVHQFKPHAGSAGR